MMKHVIRLKKQGYRSLLKLAEYIELLLACDVKETLTNDLKYKDIEQMLDKMMINRKREEV